MGEFMCVTRGERRDDRPDRVQGLLVLALTVINTGLGAPA